MLKLHLHQLVMAEEIPAIPTAPVATANAAPAQIVIVKRKFPWVATVAIALVAVAATAGAFWYFQDDSQNRAHSGALDKPTTETLVRLDSFTVNLADNDENHFLRVTMELAIEHMPAPLESGKANSGLPVGRIRDAIVSVLTLGKADVLLTPEGKQQLKRDLLNALNRETPELGIRQVYFTEFLVQR